MTAKPRDLPVHSPAAQRVALDSAFARRVLGRREARRLAELMDDAERRARERIETATLEAEKIFVDARAEALALLARLPDFERIEASPAAMAEIRAVADKFELPIAAVVGKQKHGNAGPARFEAVRRVAEACPHLSDRDISALFSGLSQTSVQRMLAAARRP